MTHQPSDYASGFLQELSTKVFAGRGEGEQRTFAEIGGYYARMHKAGGARAQTLLWPSKSGQFVRFANLARLMNREKWRAPVSIADYGCAYGTLFTYLASRWWRYPKISRYVGYDICETLLDEARHRIQDPRVTFMLAAEPTETVDYTLASGTFGLRMDTPPGEWRNWVHDALKVMARTSRKGFAFNMLDTSAKYPEDHGMYQADLDDYREFCEQTFDGEVSYTRKRVKCEWTMYVRFV